MCWHTLSWNIIQTKGLNQCGSNLNLDTLEITLLLLVVRWYSTIMVIRNGIDIGSIQLQGQISGGQDGMPIR